VIAALTAAVLSLPVLLGGVAVPAEAPCRDDLARVVHAAGWRGDDARIAWAIGMRESRGHERLISSTGDFGIWQLNRAAHSDQPWWDSRRLLTAAYNAKVAYRLSQGGKTFYPWDISGRGEHLGRYTSSTTYAAFVHWYDRYPKACR
jgi:hypothetical protein